MTEQEIVTRAVPKLTKMTKTVKIQFIKDAIKEGKFDRDEIAQVLDIKDRQVRRYLNEIALQDAAVNPDSTSILRSLCLKNLIRKAALEKLSQTSEVAIVLAGEAKKVDLKAEIKEIKLEWQVESNPPNQIQPSPQTTGISQQ